PQTSAPSHSPYPIFSTDPPTTEIYTLSLHDALPISRAVARFPARAAGSEICYLCREREAGPRKATHHPDSKPTLRRTVALAKASVPRWPNRARCGNWTRSAPLHSPRAAQCCVSGLSRAADSEPSAAGPGPWAFAAKTHDENRGRSDRAPQETHCGWRDRRWPHDH